MRDIVIIFVSVLAFICALMDNYLAAICAAGWVISLMEGRK